MSPVTIAMSAEAMAETVVVLGVEKIGKVAELGDPGATIRARPAEQATILTTAMAHHVIIPETTTSAPKMAIIIVSGSQNLGTNLQFSIIMAIDSGIMTSGIAAGPSKTLMSISSNGGRAVTNMAQLDQIIIIGTKYCGNRFKIEASSRTIATEMISMVRQNRLMTKASAGCDRNGQAKQRPHLQKS